MTNLHLNTPSRLHFPFYSPLLRGAGRVARVRRLWPKATSAAGLTADSTGRKIRIPQISHVEIASEDGNQVSAVVDMSTVGLTSRHLQSKIETVAASLHAFQIRVERIDPAMSRITISFDPPDLSSSPTDGGPLDLEQFPISLDPTGNALLSMTTSVLIGGASESGKSNLVWYILSQLNQYQIPYRLHVIDPAGGVELSDLENSPLTRQYCDRVKEIPQVVESFRKSMDKRLEQMKRRRIRRHTPTRTEPLEILIIDEILLAKSQLKGGDADSPLGEILAAGRKALHIVIACSQLGEKLVIGQIRDLFQQRICLRTRSAEMTDTVLGTNATTDGANCHRITSKGEGYIFTDFSGVFEKFQAPFVRETAQVATGGTTTPSIPSDRRRSILARRNLPHFTYQFFDQNDPNNRRPAYVGIARNPRQRFKQHERDWPQETWRSIVQSRTKITRYPDYYSAKDMETKLIEYWNPKYNVQERTH